MDREYHRWEPYFRELRDNIQPTTGRFTDDERRTSSTHLKKIVDSKARKAQRTLTAGLMSGMTSPSRPWFKLGLLDKDLQESPNVDGWLHLAETRMYDVLRGSNIYRTLESAYRALSTYGTFAGLITPSFETVVHGHSFPMGRYRIAEGANGSIDFLHRDCRMTVHQMVERFGLENCSMRVKRHFDKGDWHQEITCLHAVEVRVDRDTSSPLPRDMPMASIYWEKGEAGFLDIGGFGVRNILAPRWEQTESEAWSTNSPGMDALGDVVQLQQQHRDKAMAIQKMHNPPLMGSNTGATATHMRNIPGGITTVSTNDLSKGGLRPVYEVRPDIQWLVHDINETRERISQAFFEDLFLLTIQSDRRQVTAREIAERHEEKLLVLGPVLESLDHALLSPLIEATFHYMQQADLLPPAPDELQGQPLNVEYVSALAQAQKAVGVAPIERVVGFAGTLEQVKPGTMDLIDEEAVLRSFAEQIGPPPEVLRTREQVEEIRRARMEEQQAQQLMQNAGSMAGAASLLADASERGQELQGPSL